MGVGGQVPELVVVAVVVRCEQGGAGGGVELEGGDEALPFAPSPGGPAGAGQALDDAGQDLNGAVAPQGHRSVARVPVDVEAALGGALLADDDGDGVAPPGAPDVPAAHLGDAVAPGDGLGLGFPDPRHAQSSTGLLVGGGHEGEGARGARSPLGDPPGQVLGDDGHRGGEVQHVHGAAPPHDAVGVDARGEGLVGPLGVVSGDDVGVPDEGEGLGGGV